MLYIGGFLIYNIEMFNWLKKHFIPHEGNDHQPGILRDNSVRMLMVLVFILEIGLFVLPFVSVLNLSNTFTASVLPAVLDDLTNQNREELKLDPLIISPFLNRIAELKAQDMASKGYFAHVSPEGKTPWYWFDQVGYKYEYAGENLAIDFTDSKDVTVAWMNSPTHKANIIKKAYTEIGTGIATGTYEGSPTVFVAQVYAKPAVSTPKKISVTKTEVLMASTTKNISASTSAKVLGSEIAVTGEVSQKATTTPALFVPIVDKKPVEMVFSNGFIDEYLTSPRHIASVAFMIIAILIALALIFKMFIRMDKRHPRLITNGLVLLIVICGLYAGNNYISQTKLMTTTSFTSFDSVETLLNK
jgi:Cysteine-rich secretory protein family